MVEESVTFLQKVCCGCIVSVNVFVYVGGRTFALACIWRAEGSSWESFLSFHHVSPRDQAQVVILGSECLYLLSLLVGPRSSCFCGERNTEDEGGVGFSEQALLRNAT